MSFWWIALTICMPLGAESRDCARVVIHPDDLGQVWTERAQCERVLPTAVLIVRAQLDNSGWGAAWIEDAQCATMGQQA